MKKRNMSLILVLALILCLIPATAFADGTTIPSGEVKDTVTISSDTEITGQVTVTSGKIIVKNGATLTINSGYYLYLCNDDVRLEIEEGGTLVVNGILYTKKDLGDNIKLLGSMKVSGSKSGVETNRIKKTSTGKIGGTAAYPLQLGENAVATITSLEDGGYNYEITSGTATTNNFTNSGKDELVVANGAVLNATNGLTLNSQAGASANQLTVQDGGKLITDSQATGTLASIFGATTAVTQDKITSGTYTEDPTPYVAKGYDVKETTSAKETTYTVNPAGILSKIAVVVKEPVVGETPATTFKSTVTDKGSATASECDGQLEIAWFKIAKADYVALSRETIEDWTLVDEGEKFQKDYYYAFLTVFKVTDGYEVSDNLAVTVNGKKADLVVSGNDDDSVVVSIAKVFGPLAEKSPATGDNNELGLFAVAGLISALGVALMLRRKHSM